MQNITVTRYESDSIWDGYVQPEDQKWILFIDKLGRTLFYPKRGKNGAVIGKPLYDKRAWKKQLSKRCGMSNLTAGMNVGDKIKVASKQCKKHAGKIGRIIHVSSVGVLTIELKNDFCFIRSD